MIINALNITLLAGFAISVIYGIIIIKNESEIKPIFKISLISMLSFFISRLFFIVLNYSNGNVNEFSVGVLGQVAAYLFLVLAGTTYLPVKAGYPEFDLKAAAILLFPLIVYGYSFIAVKTVSEIVCSLLYLCSTSLALYFSFKNILSIKDNVYMHSLKPYFISVMTITITSTLESVVFLIEGSWLYTVVCIVLTIVAFIDSIIMLPILYRGLQK